MSPNIYHSKLHGASNFMVRLFGGYPINTFAQKYVMKHQKELGLSDIRWGGGNEHELRLAQTCLKLMHSSYIDGAIYLYNAGIIHGDLYPKNIMIQLTPTGEIVGVKIIDLDFTTVFEKEQDWQPINPNTNDIYH
ncbi:hypothetical protein BDF22DRAFT_736117 [Syncephalis plumigaleata]|nr:hypothetical protein BDF22DRAFT_736117 [Syncephalis plumigaleata]